MVALSSQKRRKGFTLVELLVVIVIIGILSSLLIPAITHAIFTTKVTACGNNQRQLYQLGVVYASSHKGNWPSARGGELWLSLRRMVPPLIETEQGALLACQVKGDDLGPDETDYRGPTLSWNKIGGAGPLCADKEGNHGDDHGGNCVLKDGSVQTYDKLDPKWIELSEKLSP